MSQLPNPARPDGVGQPSTEAPGFAPAGIAADAVPIPSPGLATDQLPVPDEAAPARESVLTGVLFALGGIVIGVVAAIVCKELENVLHLNSTKMSLLLALVPSTLMTFASVWLYTKGSGGALRKGVGPLILVLVVGLAAAVAAALATDGYALASKIYPGDSAKQLDWVMSYVADSRVWAERQVSLLLYVGAAALGSFGALYGRLKGNR